MSNLTLNYIFTDDEFGEMARTDTDMGRIQQLSQAYEGDAGLDLYVYIQGGQFVLKPGERTLLSTGVAVEIPIGYYARIVHRSSTEAKEKLRVVEGTIDAGYRGPLLVHFHNLNNHDITINSGSKLAQLIITKAELCTVKRCTCLAPSQRNSKGFGSSNA